MKKTIEASEAGLKCKNRSQHVESVVRILSYDQLPQKLRQNAKKYVRNIISWSQVADQHIELYKIRRWWTPPKLNPGLSWLNEESD
jgi:hypothetical protein